MKAKEQQTEPRAAYEWVQALIGSVLAVVLLFTFVVRVVVVDGSSMRETLQDQDLILLLNDSFCGEYEAQDIVVLSKETFENGSPIVKRVIATEGQTVDIDFNAGVVADGTKTLDEAAEALMDEVLLTASGKRTCGEERGFREISIFKDGVVL